ncbi:MAG: PrsW family glutamic-type intramembrane protease [bacterium]|nr:PrsW family glutamic-type intramembrane protease [bacterium]
MGGITLNDPLLLAIVGLLPGFIWLFFFLREDRHPEPKKVLIWVFIAGAISTIPTLLLQFFSQRLFFFLPTGSLLLFFILAIIEEVFKFSAAYAVLKNNPAFDEPIDAMIYIIAAAMGFATIENILIATSSVGLTETTSIIALRFIGATLLHALSAGLLGYYWAKGLLFGAVKKYLIIGFLIASFVHALFNSLIVRFQESYLVYGSLLLLVAAFFVLKDFEKLKNAD